jgi:hypothetical protein
VDGATTSATSQRDAGPRAPLRIVGLDWSGASRAGKKIWDAHVEVADHPRLVHLGQPFAAKPARDDVLRDFGAWFAALRADLVGMDFCFGLEARHVFAVFAAAGQPHPSPAVDPATLGALVDRLYPTPEAFKVAMAPEAKRETDRLARSPFAPTNLRMYRQTYLGLRCLSRLSPIPAFFPWRMQGGPLVVEVLPAIEARRLGHGQGYKGRSAAGLSARRALIGEIGREIDVPPTDARRLESDTEGDAIDAVLAALAALRAHATGFSGFSAPTTPAALLEGWIVS